MSDIPWISVLDTFLLLFLHVCFIHLQKSFPPYDGYQTAKNKGHRLTHFHGVAPCGSGARSPAWFPTSSTCKCSSAAPSPAIAQWRAPPPPILLSPYQEPIFSRPPVGPCWPLYNFFSSKTLLQSIYCYLIKRHFWIQAQNITEEFEVGKARQRPKHTSRERTQNSAR